MPDLLIPARFNGPPQSGNGGWVSGALAEAFRAQTGAGSVAVTVRLTSPPPLDTPLRVVQDGDTLSAYDGDHLIGTARAADCDPGLTPPPVIDPAMAIAAEAAYPRAAHPFPECFVCGPDRADGLGLAPGPVPDRADGLHATRWTAAEVTPMLVWAALDCPSGWAAGMAQQPIVLGTFTVRLDEAPGDGEEVVITSLPRGTQGRKHHSASAMYAGDRLLARAEAVWIAVDPASVRPR